VGTTITNGARTADMDTDKPISTSAMGAAVLERL
jgi:hypothetical protein